MSDDRAPGQPRRITYDELLALRAEHADDGPEEFARVMRWAEHYAAEVVADAMARGREVDNDAEVQAAKVAEWPKAQRRLLTVTEVRCDRCDRCDKDSLLLRIVAIPGHPWLAIPSRRTRSRWRRAYRARWVVVPNETWRVECQRHGAWIIGWAFLDGTEELPGLTAHQLLR